MLMDMQLAEPFSTRTSLELMYHVSRELASALDLRTVLERVLFLSMSNVGAINGSIIVLDDGGQPIESIIITGSNVHTHTTRQLRAVYERGLAGWVTSHNQAVLIPNTSQDERWLRRPDDAEGRTGPKSAVSAPITVRDRVVGVMTLVHPSPGFFNQDHLELVQAIADQAGIAVLNARLYADSQRQARVMTALAESAAVITASLKLEDVLQRILEQISQALRVEVVSSALIDPEQGGLVFMATTGRKSQNVVGIRLEVGQGVAGWVAKEGRGVVIPDTRKDPRFYPEVDKLLGFQTRAIACAPIRSEGKVIGILEALNPINGVFDPDALLVLSGIGSLAGTAIRHAQLFERLVATQQRYQELFEDSIDPILVTDWNGYVMEANRQAEIITGVPKEALAQMSIDRLQVVNPEVVGERYANLANGEIVSYEAILHNQAGREVPVQVYTRRVHIESVPHLQWILHDLTERKDLDNLRNDLISMIYHDLRSPLTNVVSSLDILGTMLPQAEFSNLTPLLEIATHSVERIQRLTNSLLDMRQLEAGTAVVNRLPASPLVLAREATEAVYPLAANKGQEIKILDQSDLPMVAVDADMVRRVLINLLENAVKYTPSGSKIYVSASRKADWVLMSVQDSGPGIPDSEHERIFDKFTRLHGKDGPRGFGLGLAYCRLAVEGHGGRIWVESQPGCGASFIFTLPIAREALESTERL